MATSRVNMILAEDEIVTKEPFAIDGKFQILCAMPENPFIYLTGETTGSDLDLDEVGLVGVDISGALVVFTGGVYKAEFLALGNGDRILLETPDNDPTDGVIYSLTGAAFESSNDVVAFASTNFATSGTLVDQKVYKVSAAPAANEWGNRTVTLEAQSPHPSDKDKWVPVRDPRTSNTYIEWRGEGFIEVEGSMDLIYRMKTNIAGPQASLNAVRNWTSSRPGR